VYQILSENNLTQFYELRLKDGVEGVPALNAENSDFDYFDAPEFIKNNLRSKNKANIVEVEFLLRGVHCLACIWLLERLPQLCPGVIASRVNFGNSSINVVFVFDAVKV
jgi:hypothetical protein